MPGNKLNLAVLTAAVCIAALLAGMTAAAAQQNGARSDKPARAVVLVPGTMAGPGAFGPIGSKRLCDPRSIGLTQLRTDWISRVLRIKDEQKTALNDLETASAKAVETFSAACPRKIPRLQTSTEQLEMMQKRLDAAVEAMKTVRPAFDSFYASLDNAQKQRLDRLGPKRHGWRF